ncbi:MAG: hypothetical protein LBQ98_10050 [Nitrososphaerota archaeon]|jgi:hypothetical protein|nr:hypothetical protein [Nitrososphaerota archaeon]
MNATKSGPILRKEKTLKRKNENKPEYGNAYTYTAIKRHPYPLAAFSVRK